MSVLVTFDVRELGAEVPTAAEVPAGPFGDDVDLGDGRLARRTELPVRPDGSGPSVVLELSIGSSRVAVMGTGVGDAELLDTARGIEIADGPDLVVTHIPDGLQPGKTWDPAMTVGGPSAAIDYDLPDGSTASVEVTSAPLPDLLAQDVERIRANPTATELVRPLRGAEAVVRRFPGMTSVVWQERPGILVEVYLTPADPTAIADEGVVDSIVELDEATFQELLAAHPRP